MLEVRQTVALFLNGEKPKKIPDLHTYAAVMCTDGAFHFLCDCGITPDLIIGDFDSITQLPADIPHLHTPDQNFTDFEKAIIHIAAQGYEDIDVFAANGLEQDHFLGNLTTALKYKDSLKITFYDDKQSYYFIEKQVKICHVMGKTISLFPFPKASKVHTTGLKYPLLGRTLSIKNNQVGTRNKAIAQQIEIQFKHGNLLVFVEI